MPSILASWDSWLWREKARTIWSKGSPLDTASSFDVFCMRASGPFVGQFAHRLHPKKSSLPLFVKAEVRVRHRVNRGAEASRPAFELPSGENSLGRQFFADPEQFVAAEPGDAAQQLGLWPHLAFAVGEAGVDHR